MKKMTLYFSVAFSTLFCFSAHAQTSVAESNLVHGMANTSYTKIKTSIPADEDKSKLEMGKKICINVDGVPTPAMVTGGGGPTRGTNKDSYSVQVLKGPKAGPGFLVKPSDINNVGECVEEYIPAPVAKNPSTVDVDKLEKDIIKEVNIVRMNPKAYADELAKLDFRELGKVGSKMHYYMIGDNISWTCMDNNCMADFKKKVEVAIAYLRSAKPLGMVAENAELRKASELLAADKSKIDGAGHRDSQGRNPWARGTAAGYKNTLLGECLNSGQINAAGFVVSFLTSPGHRDILMKEDANEIGVKVSLHPENGDIKAYLRDVIIMGKK